jgi:hypothetical protein
MDTARNIHTLDLVEAEELWNIDSIDRDGYICRGCETKVFPASYNKELNKKRPYFTLAKNEHRDGCDVDGEETIIKRAKKEKVGTPEGFPIPFPNKLIASDKRPAESPDDTTPTGPRSSSSSNPSGASTGPKRHHGHSVKTIRSVCRAFINYPNDRPSLPLSIPGVPGNNYLAVFKYLRGKPELLKEKTRLHYAPIRWAMRPTISEEYCELTLNAGEWDEGAKAFKGFYKARVDWTGWSKVRRNSLLREFEATREEARERAQDKDWKGWLFFVGTHDDTEPYVLHVKDFRLICSLFAKIDWPTFRK